MGLQAETVERQGPLVELSHITKRYPGVVANDDIALRIHAGEVHALLGENGAGKSTLIGILAGMVQPDAGSIRVAGAEVRIGTPRAAIDLGIGTVFQHSTLVPSLTVLENLMLGGPWHRRRDSAGTRARLAELAALLGIQVEAEALAGNLALGQQQQIEIVKALWRGERVLVLDEPTSLLTPKGVQDLGAMLRRLRDGGIAIVFITHKLGEAVAFGDRVTVLRRGRLAGEIAPDRLAAMNPAEASAAIVELMFAGRAGAERGSEAKIARPVPAGTAPILELAGVTAQGRDGEPSLRGITFAVAPGEVFGIAGVDGNGQKQLAEIIAGQRRLDGGEIRLAGQSIVGASIGARLDRGLRYVTDDRLGEGGVAGLSVALNLLLKRVGEAPFWERGLIRPAAIDRYAGEVIRRADIRVPSPQSLLGTLSGGNVQKTLLARELTLQPRVVIYNKPTAGLDVANSEAARAAIREQAERGVAAIVISNELDELLELCDRIGVMLGGALAGIVENGPAAERRVGELMIGAAP